MEQVITLFQGMFHKNIDRVRKPSNEAYNATVVFPAGASNGATLRTADVLWMTLHDMVHHKVSMSGRKAKQSKREGSRQSSVIVPPVGGELSSKGAAVGKDGGNP
jgi:hypothetical protein